MISRFAFSALLALLPALASAQTARTLRGHRAPVTSVAWSPDGRTIASGDSLGKVVLSDAKSGKTRLRFAYKNAVASLAYSPDGKMLAVGRGREIRLLNPKTGAPMRVLKTIWPLYDALEFSRDGQRLVSNERTEFTGKDKLAHLSFAVSVWSLINGRILRSWTEKTDELQGTAISPDGARIVAGVGDLGADPTVWSVASGQKIGVWGDPKEEAPILIALGFSPDGRQLVAAGGYFEGPGHFDVWNSKGKRVWGATVEDWIISATWSRHNRLLAVGTDYDTVYVEKPRAEGGDVLIYDARTHLLKNTLKGHKASIAALAWSPDGQQIASASGDKTVKIWRLAR